MANQRWGRLDSVATAKPGIKTKSSRKCVWSQFSAFCASRQYELTAETDVEQLATVLLDWAFNMKKSNGEDYKESVVKTMWNTTARMLQEKFYHEYKITFNPFQDITFKEARDARDAKRRELKFIPEKRKASSEGFTSEELDAIRNIWDEETPVGLQRKFYHIVATELAWRCDEAVNALLEQFIPEIDDSGNETGRIEYRPCFNSKTTHAGSSTSKWLIPNTANPNHCPVRLFHKLQQRRPPSVTNSRIFLTPNPCWGRSERWYNNLQQRRPPSVTNSRIFLTPNPPWGRSERWYNNLPVGKNEISKWTKEAAEKIGIDTKKRKITSHSNRCTAATNLAKAAVPEQVLTKISRSTGSHGDENSNRAIVDENSIESANLIVKIGDSSEILIPTTGDGDSSANSKVPTPPEMDIGMLQTLVDEMPTPVISNQTFACDHIRNILNLAPTSAFTDTAADRSRKAPRVVFNNCTFNILPLKQ